MTYTRRGHHRRDGDICLCTPHVRTQITKYERARTTRAIAGERARERSLLRPSAVSRLSYSSWLMWVTVADCTTMRNISSLRAILPPRRESPHRGAPRRAGARTRPRIARSPMWIRPVEKNPRRAYYYRFEYHQTVGQEAVVVIPPSLNSPRRTACGLVFYFSEGI